MRRSVLLLTPLLPLVLVACEDGPNQTFSPASGTLFNNGDSPAVTDDAGNPLNATYGGSNKAEICTGDELQRQWSKMVNEPIKPPRFMAGVDLAGGDKYPGLTVEQAEQGPLKPLAADGPTRLCQPTVLGSGGNGGDVGGSILVQWGNNGEFQMEWAIPTHKAYTVNLNNGYLGKMEWDYTTPSDNKKHSYIWQIGQIIQKDGNDFILQWNTTSNPPGCGSTSTCGKQVDELYQGIVGAFAPELSNGVYCFDSGSCGVFPTGNDGIHPVIGFRPAAFYMQTFNPFTSKEAGGRIYGAYLFNVKFSPYSYARTTLKSDGIGPTATLAVGDNGKTCNLGLGNTFKSLQDNCVQVFKDPNTNTQSLNKVMGNLTHDDQNFTFSVVGVNQNYHNTSLDIGAARQFDVIHDNETPVDDPLHNIADDFTFDVRSAGPILNDAYANVISPTLTKYPKDWHGSGAIQSEWGRMVQDELSTAYHAKHPNVPKRTWHDSQCYFPMECTVTDPTKPTACADKTGADCLGTKGCTWAQPAPGNCRTQVQGAGNAAPCAAHTDGTSCTSDTGHACAWWTGPNAWRPAEGCTGFEGLTTDKSTAAIDAEDPMFEAGGGLGGNFGFRPGNPAVTFCADPGVGNFCGASGDLSGLTTDVWGGALSRVIQFLGHGQINDVPLEGRDLRYYFKKYLISYAKYMTGPAALAAGPNASPAVDVPDFSKQLLDLDYLVFDSYGGGAARGEFIDYNHAGQPDQNGKPQDPTDIELKTLLIGSNLQSVSFFRRLDREERAFFEAFAIDNSKTSWAYIPGIVDDYPDPNNPGKTLGYGIPNARVFLSNMFGSKALSSLGYADATDKTGAVIASPATYHDPCIPGNPSLKTAHYCATHQDADCSLAPPSDDLGHMYLRENGKPLLEGYCGAFGTTGFQIGSLDGFEINDIAGESPNLFTQTARVKITDYENPYDLKSKRTQIEVAVPWKPQQEGVGFPVTNPASPMQDVFVETSQLDFTGQVITPVIDYTDKCCYTLPSVPDGGVPPVCPGIVGPAGASQCCLPITDPASQCGMGPDSKPMVHVAKIAAIETEDFLGDVFLCVDPISAANRAGTGLPGDILSAHMYTSVTTILDWIAAHPGAQDACQIVIRYSPFNNYPDYIQAGQNGVRLSIDQSAGFGRVSDVTIYDSSLGVPAAP